MRPLDDPWLKAKIDAAVAPYVGKLSAESLELMREQLAETLASDPEAIRLVRGARPRVVESSGVVASDPAEAPRATSPDKKKKQSG